MKKLAEFKDHEELGLIYNRQEFLNQELKQIKENIDKRMERAKEIDKTIDANWSEISTYLVKNDLATVDEIKHLQIKDRAVYCCLDDCENDDDFPPDMPEPLKDLLRRMRGK